MITQNQRDVLFFVAAFVAKNRYSPTYREIADGLSIKSVSGVHAVVRALKSRGFMSADVHVARSFSISAKGLSWIAETVE